MVRSYNIKCHTAPQILDVSPCTVSGGFSFGAYDAAKKYAVENLPGYEVIPGGIPFQQGRKFEAINHSAQLGADIFVTETEY